MVGERDNNDNVSRRGFLQATTAALAGGIAAELSLAPATARAAEAARPNAIPAVALPKGGGAIRGIGETFQANLFTGTGNFSVPLFTSPGRSGFGPQLTLDYSSGNGNGHFGLGWQLSLPRIARKTEEGLPSYTDADVFLLSGTEELVPVLDQAGSAPAVVQRDGFAITRYRPRTEGLFARIERWARAEDSHWRVITKDNVTSIYGRTPAARVTHPTRSAPNNVYEWLIEETFDSRGNHLLYEYVQELPGLTIAAISEQNREYTQTYLRRILYGNTPDDLPQNRRAGLVRDGVDHDNPVGTRTRHYVFEALFDYGDLPALPAIPHDWSTAPERYTSSVWPIRPDPFSDFRAGFERRVLRRVRRVLMLHHFNEGELAVGGQTRGAPLVKSTELTYADEMQPADANRSSRLSLLAEVRLVGYRKRGTAYLSRSMPPVSFEYSAFRPQEQRYGSLTTEGRDPPPSLSDPNVALVDLFGDGLPDLLETRRNAYFYWRNLGEGKFDRRNVQAVQPAEAVLADAAVALGDMGGDGLPDILIQGPRVHGFYEATADGSWQRFAPFNRLPSFDLGDANTRLVDLTGDGRADVLVTTQQHFLWYQSLGEEGYATARMIPRKRNLAEFPDVYFSDPRVHLADMNGDGLSDIVFVHSTGRIDYWPSKGGYHGFGKRVTMANSPQLARNFDPQRLLLADLDGTGAADLVYVDFTEIHFWFNHSGNAWSDRQTIRGTPFVTDSTILRFADVLGTGTAALVWNHGFGPTKGGAYKYLDFCGGQKPYLLTEMRNNAGCTTRVQYAPSTKFYVEDRRQGRPWISNLPFPVHVVEKAEVVDHISRTKRTSTYKYHHGYYDGRSREYRGFGRVDSFDSEEYGLFSAAGLHGNDSTLANVAEAFHVPTVMTRTWYHTGIYFDDSARTAAGDAFDHKDLTAAYRKEFYDADERAAPLADHEVEAGGSLHEAYRTLHGAMLRSEVYALDGERTEDRPGHPFSVAEKRYSVRQLQARTRKPGERAEYWHGVFFTSARESIEYRYEREPRDPRVQHTLNLQFDAYGNVLKHLSVTYGRRSADPALPTTEDRDTQSRLHVSYAENLVTSPLDDAQAHPHDYLAPLPCESRVYELTGYAQQSGQARFGTDEWSRNGFALVAAAAAIRHDEMPDRARRQKRLMSHTRTYYRKDDLSAVLPLGQVEARALPGRTFKLALTADRVERTYVDTGLVAQTDVDALLSAECGYTHVENDSDWWLPSGSVLYSANPNDTAVEELARAQRHFFIARRYRDPFHKADGTRNTETFVDYDPYDLLVRETRDALGNRVTVGKRHLADEAFDADGNDYRVLQPQLVMDPNRNCSQVVFDALGMVVGTAAMGKPEDSPAQGDVLDSSFEPDLAQAQIDAFYAAADPHAAAAGLLKGATSRIVHDFHRFHRSWTTQRAAAAHEPIFAATIMRQSHASDGSAAAQPLVRFSYHDGFGREIQRKVEAEPGAIPVRGSDGRIVIGSDGRPSMQSGSAPRWIADGWKIWNNKGDQPVMEFEPFFSDRHGPEFDVRAGVSMVMFYDPLGRLVATLQPNHTYEKVLFGPWQQRQFDASDTVAAQGAETGDPRTDPHMRGYVAKYFATQPASWAPWHAQRIGGSKGDDEKDAAAKSAAHANTPTTTCFDSLGRAFLTLAHNGFDASGKAIELATRVVLDLEGNTRAAFDAKQRLVMRSDYDMLGACIHQASMEAGRRWTLADVSGKPVRSWDSRGHRHTTKYDRLRRPLQQWVRGTDATQSDPRTYGRDLLVGLTEYGEGHASAVQRNLRTRVARSFDQAGVVTNDEYDFKSNLLSVSRQVAPVYRDVIDWSSASASGDVFTSKTTYDALNRPITLVAPDGSALRPRYSEANLLKSLSANIRGASAATQLVTDIDYDANGLRTRIQYGNGAQTRYTYDPETLQLRNLYTRRGPAFTADCSSPAGDRSCGLQNVHYTYDAAGNVTRVKDLALPTIYFSNQAVDATNDYTYDATYRLLAATGREHLGQAAAAVPHVHSYDDVARVNLPQPGDGNAMTRYSEHYVYDDAGNFETVSHRRSDATQVGWTRSYTYEEQSLLDSAQKSNRLTSTTVGAIDEIYSAATSSGRDGYDAQGNMLRVPHLQELRWDFDNQLSMTQRQKVSDGDGDVRHGERTWYVYDAQGQRVRKVTDRAAAAGQTATRRSERIYVGAFEVYREFKADGTVVRQRESLHVYDDQRRIALVETDTTNMAIDPPTPLIRYQFNNHIGSVALELDEAARIISFEEYAPYGSTTCQSVRQDVEVPLKRYRYTGKERDEENGFYYHGARYYVPWLGRWTQCDPAGLIDGANLYAYARGSPTRYSDPSGLGAEEQSLGASMENASKAHQEAANARRAQEGMSDIEVRSQKGVGGKRDVIPDEVKTSPQGRNTVVELKARHVDSKRNQDPGKRRADVVENLGQAKKQRLALVEAGEIGPESKAKVVRVLHDSDKGKSSKSALGPLRKEAAEVRKQWVAAAEDPTEKAARSSVDVTTTTRDKFASATEALKESAARKEAQLLSAGTQTVQKSSKGAKALAKVAKAGRHLVAALPFAGIVMGQASAAHAASTGDYAGAALDEAGMVPVLGDTLDAARGGYALGEAGNELLVDSDMAMEHGDMAKAAMLRLGAGETVANVVGGLAAAQSAIIQVMVKVSPIGFLFR